jgi:hypothetical protein
MVNSFGHYSYTLDPQARIEAFSDAHLRDVPEDVLLLEGMPNAGVCTSDSIIEKHIAIYKLGQIPFQWKTFLNVTKS